MNKRRLLKLADLLEADAGNKKGIKFDMSLWGSVHDPLKPLSCGTSACAMGLAALSGQFKRAGLDYRVSENGGMTITMNGAGFGLTAAQDLFNISNVQAEYLFVDTEGEGAKGERRVAKIIREFVEHGDVPDDHWSKETE